MRSFQSKTGAFYCSLVFMTGAFLSLVSLDDCKRSFPLPVCERWGAFLLQPTCTVSQLAMGQMMHRSLVYVQMTSFLVISAACHHRFSTAFRCHLIVDWGSCLSKSSCLLLSNGKRVYNSIPCCQLVDSVPLSTVIKHSCLSLYAALQRSAHLFWSLFLFLCKH
jgi:hypothetical protein